MTKANSFKAEPWTALEKGSWSIFDDDFISNKITCKINKKSQTSGVQLKQSFSLDKESKIAEYSDQVKVWFPHKSNTWYLRLKNNAWKLHIDHGLYERRGGAVYNFYESIQGGKDLGSECIKLGFEASKSNWVCNLRAAFKPSTHGMSLYHKLGYQKDKWRWWVVNAVNPIEKTWVHSALQIARIEESGSWYLRANAGKKWSAIRPADYAKDILSDLTADYIWNYSGNTKLGLEVSGSLSGKKFNNIAAVWDHTCTQTKNTGVKVRADLRRNLAVSVKNNIEGYGSYIFGVNVADFGSNNRFTYGAQVELNL